MSNVSVNEDWFPLDTEANREYLELHHLHVYLEDAVSQLLALRQENSKIRPNKFFREYFWSVQKGSHILFREYAFISATPYNRACVVKAILHTYKNLIYSAEKLLARDYHSLLQLLWPDFPFRFIQLTFETVSGNTDLLEFRLPFKEFLSIFRQQFCLGDFTFEAKEVYDQLLMYEEKLSKHEYEFCTIKEGTSDSRQPSFVSEGEFTPQDSSQHQLSSWPSVSAVKQNSNLNKILCVKECQDLSLSNEDVTDPNKFNQSRPGSKESSSSQNTAPSPPRTSSVRGRLCPRHLSNSLHMLPPGDSEKQDQDGQSTLRRMRSKSAVNIQRSSTLPKQQPSFCND